MPDPPNMFQEEYDLSQVKTGKDLNTAVNNAWKDFWQKQGAYPNVWLLDMSVTKSLQLGYYGKS
jgi:hypothetical protein